MVINALMVANTIVACSVVVIFGRFFSHLRRFGKCAQLSSSSTNFAFFLVLLSRNVSCFDLATYAHKSANCYSSLYFYCSLCLNEFCAEDFYPFFSGNSSKEASSTIHWVLMDTYSSVKLLELADRLRGLWILIPPLMWVSFFS